MRSLVLVASMALTLVAKAADPSPAAVGEVSALLKLLGDSPCLFYRNGKWHRSEEAEHHLKMKQDHMTRGRMFRTTEEFIAGAATRSSISGEAYKVKCPDQPAVPTAQWLGERLRELRRR
jgi:hypothetical protein